MKYNNIISISLYNALALLIFASFLASCQKNRIPSTGYYSKVKKNRFPASVAKAKFNKNQVYIHCSLHTGDTRKCFKDLTNSEKEFNQTRSDVAQLTEAYFQKINVKLHHLVEKRVKFCNKNATHLFQRCLTQKLNSDVLSLVNYFQLQNNKLNGQEYLYLKGQTESKFRARLISYKDDQTSTYH